MKKRTAKLQLRSIALKTGADIVRFDFIVQNSLSPLNLELCEYCMNQNDRKTPSYFSSLRPSIRFISTEERCRKILPLNRSRFLCDTLNLDLPKGMECSLKKGPPKAVVLSRDSEVLVIGKIVPPSRNFYRSIICNFAELAAVQGNDETLKVLKWLLKFHVVKEKEFRRLRPRIANYLANCLDPGSTIAMAFFRKFNLQRWMSRHDYPQFLDCVLRHSRLISKANLRDRYQNFELLHMCIVDSKFRNVRAVLNYQNALDFSYVTYELYVRAIPMIRSNFTIPNLLAVEPWASIDRRSLILQLLWIYSNWEALSYPASAFGALRLIWRSIPHAFITFEEVTRAFGNELSSAHLRHMRDFYFVAIGEAPPFVAPRSLKHLSRTTIRQILWNNRLWLPEGIRRIPDLPFGLAEFLNLIT